MDEKYEVLCTIVQVNYIEKMKEQMNLGDIPEYALRKILFPDEWNNIQDYKIKLEALREALTDNKNLKETVAINKYYRSL